MCHDKDKIINIDGTSSSSVKSWQVLYTQWANTLVLLNSTDWWQREGKAERDTLHGLYPNLHKAKGNIFHLKCLREGGKMGSTHGQGRWAIPLCTWLGKGHLEAVRIASSIHRADKCATEEILHVDVLPAFPWVPEADFRLTQCRLPQQHNLLLCELKDGLPCSCCPPLLFRAPWSALRALGTWCTQRMHIRLSLLTSGILLRLDTRDPHGPRKQSITKPSTVCPKVPPSFAARSISSLTGRVRKNPKPWCSWCHTKYLFHG